MKFSLFPAVAVVVFLSLTTIAFAGSATWNLDPINGNWNTAANWTPGTVPNGPADVASFGQSSSTSVTLSKNVEVDSITFDVGAAAFTISSGILQLTISGTGVVNNSKVPQNFVAAEGSGAEGSGMIQFTNSATAGNAIYTQTGIGGSSTITQFHDTATAGDATFINQGGDFSAGGNLFYNSSTAGNGTFYNLPGRANGGATDFFDNSNAGNGSFLIYGGSPGLGIQGFAFFFDSSSAANSTFIVNAPSAADLTTGVLSFSDTTTAANATITLNGGTAPDVLGGRVYFFDGSPTAADATLIAKDGTNGGHGGIIFFSADSIGERSRVQVFGHGRLNISSHNSPGVGVGSIEGDGLVLLGSNNLAVGANNRNTTFKGLIREGIFSPGPGSFTKVGAGTLILTNESSYTGGTVVDGEGALLVNNPRNGGSGTGTGPVTVVAGTLGGSGSIAGQVTIGTGSGAGATLSPGAGSNRPDIFTIVNSLLFNSDATYLWKLDAVKARGGLIVADGVTINGALFSGLEVLPATMTPGTVLTAISNTSAIPIVGTFSNLGDGGMITVGSNTFQANYSGGDGNDLTLTVVP